MYKLIAISLCSIGLVLLVAFGSQHQGSWQVTQSAQADYAKNIDRMPNTSTAVNTHLPFMANRGQTDPQVKFYARTFGGTVFLTENGNIVYSLPRAGDDAGRATSVHFAKCSGRENSGLVLTEHLAGGKAGDIHGEGQANMKINCFTGSDPSRWLRNVPS